MNLTVISFCVLANFPCSPPLAAQEPTPRPTFLSERSDLNHDSIVDEADLMILMQDWGKATGPARIITIEIPGLPEDARPMRLVHIPAGAFEMGSPDTERNRDRDEGPVRTVTFAYDFYMGETEVTQAQWQALMENNPTYSYGVGNDFPVYFVSWNQITQPNGFLDRLNALNQGVLRLPSEAEWEYACRAGTSTRFSFGDLLQCEDDCDPCPSISRHAWWCGNNTPEGSKPVAGKTPNPFGLYDMHGNLWEWCQDGGSSSYEEAPTDGSAWIVGSPITRVIRGGHWSNPPWYFRSANRSRTAPSTREAHIGFRVVLQSP